MAEVLLVAIGNFLARLRAAATYAAAATEQTLGSMDVLVWLLVVAAFCLGLFVSFALGGPIVSALEPGRVVVNP